MKKFFVQKLHQLFQYRAMENLLLPFVKQKFVTSFSSKLVPPNTNYPNPSFRVAKNNNLVINANIYDYNDWKAYWGLKEIEREKLYELAQECTTIIDVGVNNGWVLMNLAKIVQNKNGMVYGFEPHPETYDRCVNNVKSNLIENVKIFNLGCGNEEAELKMFAPIGSNSGQNRIIDNKNTADLTFKKVKVIRLDKHLGLFKKIDLIKIDVEGFEMNVLLGAIELLTKWKPILFIELDDQLLKCNNSSAKELLEFLEQKEYKIYNANSEMKINSDIYLENCHFDIICK